MAYIIQYNRKECIGAGDCEMFSPEYWKVSSIGKAELKGARETDEEGIFELSISEQEYQKQKDVAGSCPAGCIKVIKID